MATTRSRMSDFPARQGLYDPRFEHDACGIGILADLRGRPSHDIIEKGLTALENLNHRGALGAEPNTGDGAGMLLQIPRGFFERELRLPEPGDFGVGMFFLPPDRNERAGLEARFAELASASGVGVIGWRDVPTDASELGATARRGEPVIRQVFLQRPGTTPAGLPFERKLYILRKRMEKSARALPGGERFYPVSLSSRTIVYKGMLTAIQLRGYFADLRDPALESAIVLIHSRFSTNTFPSWKRAHPYRYIIHNGEINTLRGNVNWMRTREALFQSPLFGEEMADVVPVIDPDGSDSAMFDNTLELLALTGRSLPHAVMMMIPEPWQHHREMDAGKMAFYRYHSTLMEPWDGPAAVGFTDGTLAGAVLDRNGLRPSRYTVTRGGLVVLASETGVLDIPVEEVECKGRLQPGRMFLVDTAAGRIISDEEIKGELAAAHPYQSWLDGRLLRLADLPEAPALPRVNGSLRQHQQAFGYSFEDLRMVLAPMAANSVEPLGSMGDDTPPAVLSNQPLPLYNYFRQMFAQVTNPPIDCIREELITGTETLLGAEGNLLDPRPESCARITLPTFLLGEDDMGRLRAIHRQDYRAVTLAIRFPVAGGAESLRLTLESIFAQAAEAVRAGASLLILSDWNLDREHAPIPALLAVGGLHHHLIREGLRTRASIILESGEPREVHHFATLLGYGADAIHPYLALASVAELASDGTVAGIRAGDAQKHFLKAIVKGVVKVMAKMGISTVQSYRGAQIFEALGLQSALVEKYFTGTVSRIEGIGLETIAEDALRRHRMAFPERLAEHDQLAAGGVYQWRKEGEHHVFNPITIQYLQSAVRMNDYELFKKYSAAVHDSRLQYSMLRSLFDFRSAETPLPIEDVEPVEVIVKRFKTGAMSYGSISQEAHEALAIAMNRLGGKSNTGEGGEDPARWEPLPDGDSKNSAIKQVASARFGVTIEYLNQAQEIQIKIAQGAKPGEGGQLPGHKVYPWIARTRHSTPGVGLISPPPHHDIYSIEDLAQLIHDLKNANPRARINVKLVSTAGVGTIAAGVAKGHADVILISGWDGGTGASPLSSIKHAGLPWELGLAETHQTLLLNNLRSRVTLETDGQLKTGRDVAVAALLGAEEFGFATGPLVSLGCMMMRVCHLNTCPVGVATQDPELRANFSGDPQYVVNFMRFVAQELREIMARLGVRTVDEMVGRSDLLGMRADIDHRKAGGVDLSAVLYRPDVPAEYGRRKLVPQDHGLEHSLDERILMDLCRPAIEEGQRVRADLPIRNIHRVVGTRLGAELARRGGKDGLPDDTVRLHFHGSAGQSFGAFLPRGVTLELEGDCNDYIGKGLSGGKLVVYPPREAPYKAEENILIGNVALYGATSGEAFIRGVAGERFAVRNSGALAVVEGVGDHGCEYMTGGRVVILGDVGRNFAAGMSGGIAYVYDPHHRIPVRGNPNMVTFYPLEPSAESDDVRAMVAQHAEQTGSAVALGLLARWPEALPDFVKVMPKDYERMLSALEQTISEGLSGEQAVMVAFEMNKKDLARVSGN